MSNNESRTLSHPVSPRVREIWAAAFKLIAKEVRGCQVSQDEAVQLAEIGDLNVALQMLEDRLSYGRGAEGVRLSRESRVRVAIAEVIADAKGLHESDPGARLEFLKAAVTKEAEHLASERETAREIRVSEVLQSEIRDSTPRLRAYIRRLDRVRTLQINRLNVSIPDQDRLETAKNRLDALFETFVRRALSRTELDQNR